MYYHSHIVYIQSYIVISFYRSPFRIGHDRDMKKTRFDYALDIFYNDSIIIYFLISYRTKRKNEVTSLRKIYLKILLHFVSPNYIWISQE